MHFLSLTGASLNEPTFVQYIGSQKNCLKWMQNYCLNFPIDPMILAKIRCLRGRMVGRQVGSKVCRQEDTKKERQVGRYIERKVGRYKGRYEGRYIERKVCRQIHRKKGMQVDIQKKRQIDRKEGMYVGRYQTKS